MTKWLKRFAISTIIATVSIVATACTGQHQASPQSAAHVPQSVTESGMTLDWGAEIKQQALRMINGSAHSVDLDIYELSDPDILHALIAAKNRNVDVRVIVDATEPHSQQTSVPTLTQAHVPVASLHIHQGISHIKMLIADGATSGVLIGGMNFGAHSWANNDASVYLPHPNPSFLAVFRWDWQRAHGQPAAAPIPELPLLTDSRIGTQVVYAISHARQSVSLEGFDVSDYDVINALESDVRRGVKVQVLLDAHQYLNKKTASKLQSMGVKVRFYRSYQSEWMHAKIVDVDAGRYFIIGSANFSHQAYSYNHEGDIELDNVPLFDGSLQQNLSVQMTRGTDYPSKTKY